MSDSSASVDWPFERLPQFDAADTPSLTAAWSDSAKQIRRLRELMHSLPDTVACAAVSGSLARMESHAQSDIDLIVVLDDRCDDIPEEAASRVFSGIWDRLDTMRAVRPKFGGIYSICARWTDLVDPVARGRIDESIITFGHRIQLLMDAQPIHGDDTLIDLRTEILRWYSETRLADIFREAGPFHWLWHDVQRYWRSLRARTCWLDADDPCKSLALNVKLRSSRLVLVFGFLHSIATVQTASHEESLILELVARLRRTPIERLFGNGGADAQTGLASYDRVWDFLRTNAANSATELPPEVIAALDELALAVQQVTLREKNGADLRPWFM